MASIIAKLQRCGKVNCHCHARGSFHGPYFWLVTYVRSERGKGKYNWKYLGKDPRNIYIKLKDLGIPEIFSQEQLNNKIGSLKKKAMFPGNRGKKSFSGKLFNFEAVEANSQY